MGKAPGQRPGAFLLLRLLSQRRMPPQHRLQPVVHLAALHGEELLPLGPLRREVELGPAEDEAAPDARGKVLA